MKRFLLCLLLLIMAPGDAISDELKDRLLSKDSAVRSAATKEIKDLDVKSQRALADLLVQQLNNPDDDIQQNAVHAISGIDQITIPSLLAALKRDDLKSRVTALRILAEIAGHHWTDTKITDQILPILAKALQDPEVEIRLVAASGLGDIGFGSSSPSGVAIPELKKALEDENGDVRLKAALTLARIQAQVTEAVPVLETALTHPDDMTRAASAWALGIMGHEAAASAPGLISLLKDEHKNVQIAAAEALGALGQGKNESLPVLIVLLKDDNPGIRATAAKVLSQRIDATDGALTVSLAEALEDPDENVRNYMAMALGRIGPAAKDAVPALAKALEKVHIFMSNIYLSALRAIATPEALKVIEEYEQKLRDTPAISN